MIVANMTHNLDEFAEEFGAVRNCDLEDVKWTMISPTCFFLSIYFQ